MADSSARQWGDLPASLQEAILHLCSPATLAVCSCVSRDFRALAACQDWAQRFASLWPLPPAAAPGDVDWQALYGLRQAASRAWLGRPATDRLAGHGGAVKACALLAERDLLFTGGVDRCLRAWDLGSGTQIAVGRRHAGTVRCIAVDPCLLATGSTDHRIRVWLASSQQQGGLGLGNVSSSSGIATLGSAGSSRGAPQAPALPFDVGGERAVLAGHAGPVSSLQLSPEVLISGSWDCTIRVWDRASLECVQLVQTGDWLSSLSLRNGLLAAACGKEVLLFRLEGGALARAGSLSCPGLARSSPSAAALPSTTGEGPSSAAASAPAQITAVECSADGRTLFVGTADGGVWVADVAAARPRNGGRSSSQVAPRPALLQQQAAEVAGLSWDHPWLAVADRSGAVLLVNAGADTAAGQASVEGSSLAAAPAAGRGGKKPHRQAQQRAVRVLHAAGMASGGTAQTAQCVCLAGSWLAAGMDCGGVATFDSSRGLAQLQAAAAARQAKAERRQRNLDQHAAQQQRRRGSSTSAATPPAAATEPEARPACSAAVSPTPSAGEQQQEESPPLSRSLSRQASRQSAKVLLPPRPQALEAALAAAGSSCRQQAWQVLRGARPGANGAGGAAGSEAGPSA